jgi:MinD-like ATPase involved in chromosome partitioning or flagellar assembly
MVKAGDEGKPFVYYHSKAPAAQAMERIAQAVQERLDGGPGNADAKHDDKEGA